jgi:ADP-heptose:LPS heptosyltransferase
MSVMISVATSPRIGVFFPGALGDFICFLPTLEALRRCAPVDLFARSEFSPLAPPQVKVRSLECFPVRRLFAPGASADARLRGFFVTYRTIYSWTGSGQKEFVDQVADVSRGRAHVFPFRPASNKLHQTDYYWSCLNGRREKPPLPIVPLEPDAVAWIVKYWAKHALEGKAVLVFGTGSGAREKNWPTDFYLRVADWWQQRTEGEVIVLVGPVEEERRGWEIFLRRFTVARGLNLAQVAALLARGALYLGNDSGITHLAAAVGTRTVALFGPSNMQQWAPRGARVTVLSRRVDCSPCETVAMKNCPHRKCLSQFYPHAVIAELERLPEIASLTRGGSGITV